MAEIVAYAVGAVIGCVVYWHFIRPLLRAFDARVARFLGVDDPRQGR